MTALTCGRCQRRTHALTVVARHTREITEVCRRCYVRAERAFAAHEDRPERPFQAHRATKQYLLRRGRKRLKHLRKTAQIAEVVHVNPQSYPHPFSGVNSNVY